MEQDKKNDQKLRQAQLQKLIRIRKVIELTDISRSYIYQLTDKGLFPRSVELVPGGTSVAWVEQEVLDWIESRIQERNNSASGLCPTLATANTININNRK